MTEARRVLVSGRVQGVAFRWSACDAARERGVCGWVRNLADGRVEAHLEGESDAVASMLAWLEVGPPAARVARVESRAVPPEGCEGFTIVR